MSYKPSRQPVLETLEEVRKWVEEELHQISQAFYETTSVELRPINAEPSKPRDGMIVYADGTDWNPGSGEGVYARENGAWVKL